MRFEEALRQAVRWMDEIDGVVAVAEGVDGDARCITVFVSDPTATGRIPMFLGQHPVVVRETDSILATD